MFARVLAVVGVLALFPACMASSPAPEAWRRSMDDVQKVALGAWTRVQGKGLVVDGELLAADEDSLVLARGDYVTLVPPACIETVTVAAFEGAPGQTIAWGVVGSLSTVSHGLFLIFSLPIWVATTGGATYGHSKAGYIEADFRKARGAEVENVRKWARFPQGLPPGYLEHATSVLPAKCGVSDVRGQSVSSQPLSLPVPGGTQ
jgi:hypothetical protein